MHRFARPAARDGGLVPRRGAGCHRESASAVLAILHRAAQGCETVAVRGLATILRAGRGVARGHRSWTAAEGVDHIQLGMMTSTPATFEIALDGVDRFRR